MLLWCASSTTSWATILLGIDGAGELFPTTRAREGPYRTLRSLDLGGIQYRAHALRIVCVVLVLPCYSVHHCAGYAPSCTWRVIAGTSHPEHEHVIFVYLEIWHPRSHPTSRFWTSRILDLWISDSGSLDLEIWRVGSGSGGPDPSRPSGYPESTPFGPLKRANLGSISQHTGTLPWPNTPLYEAVPRQRWSRLDAY